MAILSRHEGSPATATSLHTLIEHIETLLVPRVSPFLARQQRENERRIRERALRAEQDAAYAKAAEADARRVREMRERERERRVEEQRTAKKAQEEVNEGRKYEAWRRWARRYAIKSDTAVQAEGRVKIAVKLPNGKRLKRYFDVEDHLRVLFTYIETAEPATAEDDEDDDSVPLAAPANYTPTFRFSLVSGFPRAKIEPSSLEQRIKDVPALAKGGAFIVEGQVGTQKMKTIDTTDEDTDRNS